MRYEAALERLYGLSYRGIRLGLDRTRETARHLGQPTRSFRSIQVAGTNGKGSVSTLLADALARSGIEVGLFTSPHLHRFTERIRIGGQEISPEELLPNIEKIFKIIDAPTGPRLTFFEVATLAAFAVFRSRNIEVAVLEVGLGGRLDATSVAEPVLTAITSVGLDHTAILGDTLARIAAEKAAIARRGVPMILGPLPDEALEVTRTIADATGAPVSIYGRDFSLPRNMTPPRPGTPHRHNSAVAFEIYRQFLKNDARYDPEAFKCALEGFHFPGRFEILDTTPRYILDCAHNREAIEALADSLEMTAETPRILIFGALADKPAESMLERLRPLVQEVVLVPPPIERALDPKALRRPSDHVAENVEAAVSLAVGLSHPGDTVLATGSVFTVGAIRALLLNEPSDPPIGL